MSKTQQRDCLQFYFLIQSNEKKSNQQTKKGS